MSNLKTEIEILKRKYLSSEIFAKASLDAVKANICVIDKTGNIIAVNQPWKDFYDNNLQNNYHRNYCIGMNYIGICHTASGLYSEEAIEMANGIISVMKGEREEFTLEYPCNSPDEKRWFLARVTKFKDDSNNVIIAHERITDYKQAEETIRHLISAKSELDHHVKNDMSTIFNLLMIQANKQSNAEAKSALLNAAGYIRSMIVLYNRLYHTEVDKSISIREYFASLIEEIIEVFPQGEKIKLIIRIEDVKIHPKKLSTIGLILNELITNAIKHAFTSIANPEIQITIFQTGKMVTVLFADNGSTIPESISMENSTGFGLKLIGMLANQIQGSISMERKKGTQFTLQFESSDKCRL